MEGSTVGFCHGSWVRTSSQNKASRASPVQLRPAGRMTEKDKEGRYQDQETGPLQSVGGHRRPSQAADRPLAGKPKDQAKQNQENAAAGQIQPPPARRERFQFSYCPSAAAASSGRTKSVTRTNFTG